MAMSGQAEERRVRGAGTQLREEEQACSAIADLAATGPQVLDSSAAPLEELVVSGRTARPCSPRAAWKAQNPEAIAEEQLMKSRHRVKVYGEVFTQRRMVDLMLDLVREDVETGTGFVDKTFLEPAAGDGNFLVAILHRKLRGIEKRYEPKQWPVESLFALASIYGIELLEDNHRDAKNAMLDEFLRFHAKHGVPCGARTRLRRAAIFLIDTNVVRGDTLKGLTSRGEEIQFSWWHRILGSPGMVQREPFTLASLRGEAMLDLTAFDTYAECRIDRVHEEVTTRA
jgi:hypothetical protein